MTETERNYDDSFAWQDVDDQPVYRAVRDVSRVGLVLMASLLLLAGMVFVLVGILGDMFGDMWDSVFTF